MERIVYDTCSQVAAGMILYDNTCTGITVQVRKPAGYVFDSLSLSSHSIIRASR